MRAEALRTSSPFRHPDAGLIATLKLLPPSNVFRIQGTEQLLGKLYRMGLVPSTASLAEAENLPASAFARRRAYR